VAGTVKQPQQPSEAVDRTSGPAISRQSGHSVCCCCFVASGGRRGSERRLLDERVIAREANAARSSSEKSCGFFPGGEVAALVDLVNRRGRGRPH
jgi:hypothetical protein